MKDGFAAAMRRAALLTRGGDVAGATRAIRNALAGGTDVARAAILLVRTPHPRLRERPDLRLVKPSTEVPPSRVVEPAIRRRRAAIANFPACGSHSARSCAGCARET